MNKEQEINSSKLICLSCGEQFKYQTIQEHFLAFSEKDCTVIDIENRKEPIPCPECKCTKLKYNH